MDLPDALAAFERQRLEAERELASRRADLLASEAASSRAALMAERKKFEGELERQAREAADRQAILLELDHDRTELAALYREAHQELSRLRVELSERSLEVLELRRGQEQEKEEMGGPSQNTCVVCLDAPANMAAVPCGHLALCEVCAVQLPGSVGRRRPHDARPPCPVCRRSTERLIQIYAP